MVNWFKDLFKHDYVFECRFRNGSKGTIIYSIREKNVTEAIKYLNSRIDLNKHLDVISIQCKAKYENYDFSRSDLNETA